MSESSPDVIVVGAGLAGLHCAVTLEGRGLAVEVVDAGSQPGGRVRTDVVDGHLCDRGFQLLNPAYPAVRRHLDVDALRLRPFTAGVAVRREDGVAVLGDPRRSPGLLPDTLRSGLLHPGEVARLVRWASPSLEPVPWMLRGADASLADSLDAAGLRGPLRREVLDRFLAGVLADDSGASSVQFTRLLLRAFLLGTPSVPADGMRALPRQLTNRLARPVECGVRVHALLDSRAPVPSPGIRTDAGERRARAVVVATDVDDAVALGLERTATMKGLRTWWFSTAEPVSDSALLRVDGRGGPVLNSAVLSAVAPTYAPPGRNLVQATTLLPTEADEPAVRRHLERLWQVPTVGWDLLVRHDVTRALPAQPSPLVLRRPVSLGDGLFVAGDHRDTASIQGALVSGRRAANAVTAALRVRS